MAVEEHASIEERFALEELRGRGGFGEVFRATERATGRPVAIKRLADPHADAIAVERFMREARLLSLIDSVHVVRLIAQAWDRDGRLCLALEWLEGEDLAQRQQAGALAVATAVDVAAQTAAGLAAMHALGIVHRDVKPANVFLARGAAGATVVKLLDLGIARAESEAGLTLEGAQIGTPSYMSPEQARGELDLDARADVFSLGVLLYESLTGRRPFDAGNNAGTLYRILFETAAPVTDLRPDVPPAVAAVVRRAMSRARDERFPSAEAMRAALFALSDGVAAAARAVTQPAVHGSDPRVLTGTPPDVSLEHRLTSVAFVRGAREPLLLRDLARQTGGRVVALPQGEFLVVFGAERWRGDEPLRAVRLALAARLSARSIGVATDRALRGVEQITGAVVDRAALLALAEGVSLDDATARAVAGSVELERGDNGVARATREARTLPGSARAGATRFAAPLLGRDAERAMLLAAGEGVRDGGPPSAVLVLGAAGMGKSRLRHEAAAALRDIDPRWTELVVRGDLARRDAPFAALAEAFADAADPCLGRALAGEAVSSDGGDPQRALDRVRGALMALLRQLASQGPVLLAVDDAQWLDGPSREALRFVCDQAEAEGLALCLWLFARPEDRELLATVLPFATVHELSPLSRGAAERLLRAVAGAAPDEILQRAGGHPLFLEELGLLYAHQGEAALRTGKLPLSIEGAHLAQLDRLDLIEREGVKRAAVFGRTAWVEGVLALGGDEAAVGRLRTQGVLTARARSRFAGTREVTFRSALLQEVAHGLFPEDQRARLHAQAAAWLLERDEAGPDELARHWELSGDTVRAAEAHTAAAEACAHAGDAVGCARHAARAAELSELPALRFRALCARETTLQFAGARDEQREVLRALAECAAACGPRAEAEAAWRSCQFARVTSDAAGALAHGERAVAQAHAAGDARVGAAAHSELALLAADLRAFDRARRHAADAAALADACGEAWLRARAAAVLAYVQVEEGGALADALALYDRAAQGFGEAGDRRREAAALANGGYVMMRLGRIVEARGRIDAAIGLSQRVGNARAVAVALSNRATLSRVMADFDAAERDLATAASEARRFGYARLSAAVAVDAIYLALARGAAPSTLRALAADAEELAAPVAEISQSARSAALRARCAAGDRDAASAAAADALRAELEAAAAGSAEASVEAWAAVYDAGGRAASDLEALHAALRDVVAHAGAGAEAWACRESLERRFLLPRAAPALADRPLRR